MEMRASFAVIGYILGHSPKKEGINQLRLQREAYFLKEVHHFPEIDDLSFRFSSIGPTCRELSDALHYLLIDGVVEEVRPVNEAQDSIYADAVFVLTEFGRVSLADYVGIDFEGLPPRLEPLAEASAEALRIGASAVYRARTERVDFDSDSLEPYLKFYSHDEEERAEAYSVLNKLYFSL